MQWIYCTFVSLSVWITLWTPSIAAISRGRGVASLLVDNATVVGNATTQKAALSPDNKTELWKLLVKKRPTISGPFSTPREACYVCWNKMNTVKSDQMMGTPPTEQKTYRPIKADPTVDEKTGLRGPNYEAPGFFRHRHKETEERWKYLYRERASNCLFFDCGEQKWCACWPGAGDCSEVLSHSTCQETPAKLKDSAGHETPEHN